MSYNSIDSVVRSYIADQGKNTLHGYIRYMKWAMDGLKKWHLSGAYEDKTVLLKMDRKKSVTFPSDMVVWTKVGVKLGDRVAAFVNDKTIAKHHDNGDPNNRYNPYEQWPELDYSYQFLNYYNDQGIHLNVVGFGSGHNGVGYFTPNYRAKEFQFSSEVKGSNVYVEYKSSGFNPTSETLVSEVVDKLIRDYIRYQEGRFKFGDNSSETEARRITYLREQDEVLAQLSDISYEGILDVIRRTTSING